jgi:non-canonical purine NTP pyrophosphatase (RdgB/HAM1 family)
MLVKIGRLIFATGNKDKIREAEVILGVKLKGTSIEIEEIQSLDPVKVARAKARAYFKTIEKPLFVEDSSLSFEALNGLPGTYINDMVKVLGNLGLTKLILGKNRKAIAQVTIGFVDSRGKDHVFKGITKGSIAKYPKGNLGFGWDPIFIPEGKKKTFGEMTLNEKLRFSMRTKAFIAFKNWLSSH